MREFEAPSYDADVQSDGFPPGAETFRLRDERCVKRAWVEYLGEQPDPVFDRVE